MPHQYFGGKQTIIHMDWQGSIPGSDGSVWHLTTVRYKTEGTIYRRENAHASGDVSAEYNENEAVFSINCVWQGFKTHWTKLAKRIEFYLGSD